MILSTPAADSVFVNDAEAGSSLAGVENAGLGAGDGVNEFAGQGGDTAHALQEVQDHALAGKNHAGVVANDSDGLTFAKTHAIEDLRVAGDFVVRSDRAVECGVDIENAWQCSRCPPECTPAWR